jgi:hypothetical protein
MYYFCVLECLYSASSQVTYKLLTGQVLECSVTLDQVISCIRHGNAWLVSQV